MAVSADPKVVVIIGCGIAGITAAHRLIKAGFHVRILEATTRSGGRLKTGMLGEEHYVLCIRWAIPPNGCLWE